jgi:Zn finger protein HypA/HybF involved in hydrogenase expression
MAFGVLWQYNEFTKMSGCKHTNIMLVPHSTSIRLRCRYCHLTIKQEDLEGEYCPECMAVNGQRRNDFETIEPREKASVQYRCEDCGAMLNSQTA